MAGEMEDRVPDGVDAPGEGPGEGVDDVTGRELEVLPEAKPQGLVRRLLVAYRHFVGLLLGGLVAYVRWRRETGRARGVGFALLRLAAALVRPLVKRSLVREPFAVQLRRRLEILGVTYIKLGQVLALRSDLLPEPITTELKKLLDRLPVLTFDRFAEIVERDLGRPLPAMFAWVEQEPLGSASIAQTHRAATHEGDTVVLKVVKPGIRHVLSRDTRLLLMLGSWLQLLFPRFQPKRAIREFCDYTLREVDLRQEADNAETFAGNFRDHPDVVFPRIYRAYCGEDVLCMEFLDGVRPDSPEAASLPEADKQRLVSIGAEAVIRMLYRDGFFHADLHPANLLILPGPRAGFIDLGMAGRLRDELRRSLMYHYYCLVIGDLENAARYLTRIAHPAPGADVEGFRREVEDVSRRWRRMPNFREFSFGRLILESVGKGVHFGMYFPVEMVLMVKALVTYEAVGHMLLGDFDAAAVSQPHISRIFLAQFNPLRVVKEGIRGAPEVLDALLKAPLLVTEGLRVLEKATREPRERPFAGMRGTLFAGFCLVAGSILLAFGQPLVVWVPLFLLAMILALRKGE